MKFNWRMCDQRGQHIQANLRYQFRVTTGTNLDLRISSKKKHSQHMRCVYTMSYRSSHYTSTG